MQIIDKVYPPIPLYKAWMRLIRLPNIVILAAIIILLHVGIYLPVYVSLKIASPLSVWILVVFVLSVCMIAAGGNIINDYFDYDIDLINRPEKIVIEKVISKQHAMSGYMVLTIIGIIGGFLLGWLLGVFKIGFFFGFGALMLYSYSETFKRKLLVGNFIIAILGFLFILLLWIIEFFALRNSAGSFVIAYASFNKMNILMGIYALFAFLTTLIREIIKDIEDIEGDKSNGCRTLPIATSILTARLVVNVHISLTILFLILCQYLCWNNDMQILSIFIAPAIQLPLILLLIRFHKAESKIDYHAASSFMKWIMVAGILGIQLINLHF